MFSVPEAAHSTAPLHECWSPLEVMGRGWGGWGEEVGTRPPPPPACMHLVPIGLGALKAREVQTEWGSSPGLRGGGCGGGQRVQVRAPPVPPCFGYAGHPTVALLPHSSHADSAADALPSQGSVLRLWSSRRTLRDTHTTWLLRWVGVYE